jgi:hypothetical protein
MGHRGGILGAKSVEKTGLVPVYSIPNYDLPLHSLLCIIAKNSHIFLIVDN